MSCSSKLEWHEQKIVNQHKMECALYFVWRKMQENSIRNKEKTIGYKTIVKECRLYSLI